MGKGADDIFAATKSKRQPEPIIRHENKITIDEGSEQEAPQNKQEPQELLVRATVGLAESQLTWLDRLAIDIRVQTKTAINRGELIGALLGAWQEHGLDLSGLTTKEDVKTLLLEKLRG